MKFDHEKTGKYWNSNADTWTRLTRAGYDKCRIYLTFPAFLKILPKVKGLRGLDIGCGEGSNTREIQKLGAQMTGIDISEKFIYYAKDRNETHVLIQSKKSVIRTSNMLDV